MKRQPALRLPRASSVLCACALAGAALAQAVPGTAPITLPVMPVMPVMPAAPVPGAAATTPAAASGPVTLAEDYRIAPNDLLEVEVFGISELKRTVRVSTSGHIAMPLIGQIEVVGLSAPDAEALIALQYSSKYLRDPQVSIFIREFTTQRITLDGAVARPGIYPLTGQITLLRALALAGGGAAMADLEQVMLFRKNADGPPVPEKHDVLKIRKGEAPDPLLRGDDIVVVNRDGRRTALRDSLFRDVIDTLNPFR